MIVVLLLCVPAVAALFRPGYFNMHDDLQMMRQLQLEKCLLDGQIPCRWVPDMGYGYGYPLFNYYPQGPYLFGEIFRVLGLSFVWTAKMTFAAAVVGSALTMFILTRRLWGGWAAFAASGFYIYAPYRAVDIYVRGAMNESWSFVWFPLILWAVVAMFERWRWRYLVWLAIGWAGLFLSHNLITLVFAPVFAGWVGFWMLVTKKWRVAWRVLLGLVWGFLLVAFFELPVIFEQKLVRIEGVTSDYYNFLAHFVSLKQMLISRFWGYGGSFWGTNDEMSFQIGWWHWGVGLAVLLWGGVMMLRRRREGKKGGIEVWAGVLMAAVGWFAAFMMHERSILVWKLLPTLAILQFPWRFLTLVVLGFSVAAGALVAVMGKFKVVAVTVLLLACLGLYGEYFMPGKWGPLSDEEKFSGEAWRKQQSASITDYLPKTVDRVPISAAGSLVEVVRGEATVEAVQKGTNWVNFGVDSDGGAVLRLEMFDFPKWRVFLDEKEVEVMRVGEDDLGRIGFKVPAGRYQVRARLFDTRVRQWGNVISLLAVTLLVSSWWWRPLLRRKYE